MASMTAWSGAELEQAVAAEQQRLRGWKERHLEQRKLESEIRQGLTEQRRLRAQQEAEWLKLQAEFRRERGRNGDDQERRRLRLEAGEAKLRVLRERRQSLALEDWRRERRLWQLRLGSLQIPPATELGLDTKTERFPFEKRNLYGDQTPNLELSGSAGAGARPDFLPPPLPPPQMSSENLAPVGDPNSFPPPPPPPPPMDASPFIPGQEQPFYDDSFPPPPGPFDSTDF